MTAVNCSALSLSDFRAVDAVDRELDRADTGPRVIGDQRFETAAEAKATVKAAMVAFSETGEPWARDFLHEVAKLHPSYSNWIVCTAPVEVEAQTGKRLMLKQYERQRPGETYRRAFLSKPISLNLCLNVGSQRSRVVAAARRLVIPNIEVRHRIWCGVCGDIIDKGDLHWDHYPTFFIDLFDDWRSERRLLCSEIKLCPNTISFFADRQLCRDWQDYHDSRATLRPAHSRCNLQNRKAS